MSDEAVETINKYFHDEQNEMHYFGNADVAQEVANCFSNGNILTGDAPDLIILSNGSCLIVEHFEFDCYKNNRSGSENRKEQARVEKVFRNAAPHKKGKLVHDVINGTSSYNQYIKNITEVFSEHYKRIPNYKSNLIENGFIRADTQIKMSFLIEDVSPLGTMAYCDDTLQPIVLALSKEFLGLMHESPDVDFVIACSGAGSNNYLWLIINNDLDVYIQNTVDYAKMSFIDFTPQVLSYRIELSKNEDGDK